MGFTVKKNLFLTLLFICQRFPLKVVNISDLKAHYLEKTLKQQHRKINIVRYTIHFYKLSTSSASEPYYSMHLKTN